MRKRPLIFHERAFLLRRMNRRDCHDDDEERKASQPKNLCSCDSLVWTTCCWLSPLGITLGDVIAAVHSNEPALGTYVLSSSDISLLYCRLSFASLFFSLTCYHSCEVCSPQSKPWMDKCACNCKRGLLSSLL